MAKVNKESLDRFFEHGVHLETRTIYIGDSEEAGVDHAMSEKAIKALHALVSASKESPIRIILNSIGGNWTDGMAIFNFIETCPCHVTIEAYGSCMSMASLILQSADERLVAKDVVFMIHDGSDSFEGEAKNFEIWGKHSEKIRKRMYEIYSKVTKKDVKFWQKKCSADFIITAEQAVELGLADKVIGNEEQ